MKKIIIFPLIHTKLFAVFYLTDNQHKYFIRKPNEYEESSNF